MLHHWNVFGYGAELIALVFYMDVISIILKTDDHHGYHRSGCAEGPRRNCASPHMYSPALFQLTFTIFIIHLSLLQFLHRFHVASQYL
ncbi:hypothetical protein EDD22DRAFT_882660, partial [Suillus occidentalis]